MNDYLVVCKLENAITNSIKKFLNFSKYSSNISISIAYSGGIDSTVLLYAAAHILVSHKLYVFHINHHLSKNAQIWQEHCSKAANLCSAYFCAADINICINDKRGIEAAARVARYDALVNLAKKHSINIILLGHNANDQAETVLLQALRGSGLAGLSAMPTYRCINNIWLIRPFLSISREQLNIALKWYMKLSNNKIIKNTFGYIHDESNDNPKFLRNSLRFLIQEKFKKYFPSYHITLTRVAKHAAEAMKLIDELADIDLHQVMVPEKYTNANELQLYINKLLILTNARLCNVMRRFLKKSGVSALSTAKLDNILINLRNNCQNFNIQFNLLAKFDEFILFQNKNKLKLITTPSNANYCKLHNDIWQNNKQKDLSKFSKIIFCQKKNIQYPEQINLSQKSINFISLLKKNWILPDWGGYLQLVKIQIYLSCKGVEIPIDAWPIQILNNSILTVCPRVGGERMKTHFEGHSRTLKNLFQEAKIPYNKRIVPIFRIDNRIAFIPYIGIDYAYLNELKILNTKLQNKISTNIVYYCQFKWEFI